MTSLGNFNELDPPRYHKCRSWNYCFRRVFGAIARWYGAALWRFWLATILMSLALSVAVSAGYVLLPKPHSTITDLWLPVGGWQSNNRAYYETQWGAFRTQQMIVVPRKASSDFVNGPRKQLLDALELYEAIWEITVTSKGGVVFRLADFCFQPGSRYMPGCLYYSPMLYWGSNRTAIELDPSVGTTIASPTAPGPLAGTVVRREQVFGGVEYNGTQFVQKVSALLFWFYLDASDGRGADANLTETEYQYLLRQWETKFLSYSDGKDRSVVAHCKIASSEEAELQAAASGGLPRVRIAVAVLWVLFLVVALMVVRGGRFKNDGYTSRRRWLLGFACAWTLKSNLTMTMGAMGYACHAGWTTWTIGSERLFVMLLAVGAVNRFNFLYHYIVKESPYCRYVGYGKGPKALLEGLAERILPASSLSLFLASGPLLAIAAWSSVPGVRSVCLMAGMGLLVEWFTFTFSTFGILACYLRYNVSNEDEDQANLTFLHDEDDDDAVCDAWGDDVESSYLNANSLDDNNRGASSGHSDADCGSYPASPDPDDRRREVIEDGKTPALFLDCIGQSSYRFFLYYHTHVSVSAREAIAVTLIMCVLGVLVLSYFAFQNHFPPKDLSPSALISHSSYLYSFISLQRANFLHQEQEVDFVMRGVDWANPDLGPWLEEVATALAASPFINATSFRNWYSSFREWCSDSKTTLCRYTMVNGYPTEVSFGELYIGLWLETSHTRFGQDIMFSGPNLLHLNLTSAKFAALTVADTTSTYSGQRVTTDGLHELTQSLRPPPVGNGDVFAYAPGFNLYEVWSPARTQLMSAITATLTVCAVALVLFIEPVVVAAGSLSFGACVLGMFGLGYGEAWSQDVTFTTATSSMSFLPLCIIILVPLAYYYSSITGHPQQGRKRTVLQGDEDGGLGYPMVGATSFSNADGLLEGMGNYAPARGGVFVVPIAAILAAALCCVPISVIVFAGEPSPINGFFGYSFSSMFLAATLAAITTSLTVVF